MMMMMKEENEKEVVVVVVVEKDEYPKEWQTTSDIRTRPRKLKITSLDPTIGHTIDHTGKLSATENVHIGHRPCRPSPYRTQVGNKQRACYVSIAFLLKVAA